MNNWLGFLLALIVMGAMLIDSDLRLAVFSAIASLLGV